jgi:hypothetical protein
MKSARLPRDEPRAHVSKSKRARPDGPDGGRPSRHCAVAQFIRTNVRPYPLIVFALADGFADLAAGLLGTFNPRRLPGFRLQIRRSTDNDDRRSSRAARAGRTPQTRGSQHAARRAGPPVLAGLAGLSPCKRRGSPYRDCRATARLYRTGQPAARVLKPGTGQARIQQSFRFSSANCRPSRRLDTSCTGPCTGLWVSSLEFSHASLTGLSHRTWVCDPLHDAHGLKRHHYSGDPQSIEFNRAPSPTDCAAGRTASGHAKL